MKTLDYVSPPLLSRKRRALFTIYFFTTFISFKTIDQVQEAYTI